MWPPWPVECWPGTSRVVPVGKRVHTEFEQNWMVEVGPRYRKLTDKERLENPLPKEIDPTNVGELLETLRTQEKRWFRWLRKPSQKPMPLKWERIYVGQLFAADAHLNVRFNDLVRKSNFRRKCRKLGMRLFMLWALWVIVAMVVPDPNEWMLLLQVPWKAPEVLWNRLLEQQIAILAEFEQRFVSQWPIWIGLGVAYVYCFFPRPPMSPSAQQHRAIRQIRYLCRDGMMLKTGQLVQWSGLKVVSERAELFEIKLQSSSGNQLMLHVDCTLEQYIPIYLFVKRCLSSS